MNAHELINRIEHAENAARIDAARKAVIEIFNAGVNRGKVEYQKDQTKELESALEESMRNNAALKEQLAKNEVLKAEIYDAAFLHGYAAGKEAATRQTTAGGSLAPDPA